jgi:hypothetical protein
MKDKERIKQAVIAAKPRDQVDMLVRQITLDADRNPAKMRLAIVAMMRLAYVRGMMEIVDNPTDMTSPAVRFERWLDADTTKGSVN